MLAVNRGLGADGVEVHEPALENRTRHLFQRSVYPLIQLYLVVQRARGAGDGLLFIKLRNRYLMVA